MGLGIPSAVSDQYTIDLPRPFFRVDHVWSTERDELGVQYVVRYPIAAEHEPRSR